MGNHTVFFATNRMPIGSPPSRFSNELGPVDGLNLRYGVAEVFVAGGAQSDQDKVMDVQVSDEQPYIAEEDGGPKWGSDKVLGMIQERMKNDGGRDCLVVIHGFWNSFENSILGAARIAEAGNLDLNLFAFCWPSHDNKFEYKGDRKRAQQSGPAMARAVRRAYDFIRNIDREQRCEREIHLLAHSMGNYALRWAVQDARKTDGDRVPPIFSHVLLVAADEDADALESMDKLKPLARVCRDITVYHTPIDLALDWSREIKNNRDRLGSRGPSNLYQVDRNVVSVDVTEAVRNDGDTTDHFVDHYFHRVNPIAVDDMARVLTDRQPKNRKQGDHPQAFLLTKPAAPRGRSSR